VLFIRASSAYVEGSSLFSSSVRAHTHMRNSHTATIFQKINDKSRVSYFVPRIFHVCSLPANTFARNVLHLGMLYKMRASDAENGRLLVINCERTLTALSYLACALVSPSLSRLHHSRLIILLLSLPACCGIYTFRTIFCPPDTACALRAPQQFCQRAQR
jgi:hypothetical protein